MDAPVAGAPPLGGLAAIFAWFGNSTFGGGTATIVELERQLIDRREWLSRDDSHIAYAISRLTPGTNLLAYCVAVGWRMRRLPGAVVALGAASLPAALLAIALTRFFSSWVDHPLTAHALNAALAAAVAIMVGTVWTMIRPLVQRHHYLRTLCFAVGAVLLATVAELTPFRILVAAAIVGAIYTEPAGPA